MAAVTAALVGQPLAFGGPSADAQEARQQTVAVREADWHVRRDLSAGPADVVFTYGRASDEPVIGDWNGDDRPTPGVVRGSKFHLKNELKGGRADRSFAYGRSSDVPLMGDWDGDGRETVGVRRGSTFHLKNRNSSGDADISFAFGRAEDEPIVGDWNGDGRDTVGVVRGSTFHLRDEHRGGAADRSFTFGKRTDLPVAGDWDGDGRDTVGVVRGSTFYLRNAHRGGAADESFAYGSSSDDPLVWSGAGTLSSASLSTWDALAECESNGNWSMNSGNGFYGGLQFNKDSWDWAGGQQYAEWPHEATRLEQIAVGERLLEIHPAGWGAWPHCSELLGLG